jgi:signal transduction histidine kinase
MASVEIEARYAARVSRVVRGAGATAALVGGGYLAAWLAGTAARWSAAGAITMKANMAFSLLVAGAALLLVEPAEPSPARRWAAAAGGALVLLVGALTLGEHLFGSDLGIDQLIAVEAPGAANTVSPNRIGVPGSTSLALLGAGLVLAGRRRPLAAYLGLATCVVVATPALGFLYGVRHLYSGLGGIAWPTVVALLALGLGLALSRRDGPFAIVWRDDPGGELVRRLLVPLALVVLVLGYVRVQGERLGLYGVTTGTALFAVAQILVLSTLLGLNARQLSRYAALQRRTREELRAARARAEWLASFPASNPLPIAEVDAEGQVRYANAAARRLLPGLADPGSDHPWLAGWSDVVRAFREGGAPTRERMVVVGEASYQQMMYFVPEKECIRIYGMDVTDRAHAEEALREGEQRLRARVAELVEAQRALREADRRKDEFLGMLSHELRNPLAPIRSSIFLLERAEPASEQAARARGVIKRQTEHLTRIVDDLLDMTRIARGKFELHRARVDLREVVAQAADDFRHQLDVRGVALRTELPDAPLLTDADPTRLAQATGNLLHNAAKFTRRGDEVTLALRAAGDAAELSVRDTGAGIEPALLAHVFDAFVQGDRSLARTEGGLGLGLAVVKAVAELHGGTVRAESGGPGKGATFTVRIPLREEAPRPAAPVPADGPGRPRRVLVVDDNEDAAETLASVVRLLGHDAAVALDGPGALAQAGAASFDAVLCDIGLPGMTGYDVARALRASHGPAIRLVAVTGYAQPDDVREAAAAGFDAHVAKPCDIDTIARLLA